ncbi:RHS repeat-associated core domain-containing protein [Lentzea sp. PSKA42]|uniref:RHS repeat-associated core domain-containing protein n=1 Tax=Lentzea indica TaxID=2604800 RepID=A0ABX1FVW4_9PSEU|nr:RHS repeat-associated core domain-containing protein [Lentzea indica]NKE62563.1 RHS repeat-associated core domain-containing protein [Lentzea indica]
MLKTITNPRGVQQLLNEYDDKDRVKQQTAADGGVTKFEYTDVNGKITETRMTDPRGSVTRFVFNDRGQVVSQTEAFGTDLAQSTTTEFEENGVRKKSSTDALNRKTTYSYDAKGHVKESTVLAGTPEARTEKWERNGPNGELTKYTDQYGKSTVYELDARGAVKSKTDAANRKLTYVVDPRGQVTSVTDPAGKTSTTDYLGSDAVRTTDPLGRTSTVGYDALGRKVITTDPRGVATETAFTPEGKTASETDGLGRTVRFEYDRNGNRTKVIDPRGGETVFHYNQMDKIRSITDQLGVSWAEDARYDRNNNLEKVTNRRGVVVEHKYDALNRQYESTYGTESKVTRTFDLGDREKSVVDTAVGNSSNDYDGLDRIKQEVTPHGTVSYGYDTAAGVRDRTVTLAGRPVTRHLQDAAGGLQEIQQGGTAASVVTRDRAGRVDRVGATGNGVGQTYTYDDAGNVKSITYKAGTTVLGDLKYDYDALGLPIKVSGTWSRTMLPEPFGPAVYDKANRATSVGGVALQYDADGNLLSDGTATYTWNARGQLATVAKPGQAASFSYAADGRRLGRTVAGVTTNYLYDGANPVQEKVNGQVAGNMTSDGVDGHHLRDGKRFLTDALGSTVGLVDQAGAGAAYTYEPFGRTYGGTGFAYTGREDDGTGLYYYRARYYSPVLQRFLSEDPIGIAGGLNLYGYVDNGPTTQTDPTGFAPGWLKNCNMGGNRNNPAIEKETIYPKPVKPGDAMQRWDDFLGPGPHSNLNPRTGLPDPNRITSADGLRSIRFGNHEMGSKPTKFHYHEETWRRDKSNQWYVDNVQVRVPFPKGSW